MNELFAQEQHQSEVFRELIQTLREKQMQKASLQQDRQKLLLLYNQLSKQDQSLQRLLQLLTHHETIEEQQIVKCKRQQVNNYSEPDQNSIIQNLIFKQKYPCELLRDLSLIFDKTTYKIMRNNTYVLELLIASQDKVLKQQMGRIISQNSRKTSRNQKSKGRQCNLIEKKMKIGQPPKFTKIVQGHKIINNNGEQQRKYVIKAITKVMKTVTQKVKNTLQMISTNNQNIRTQQKISQQIKDKFLSQFKQILKLVEDLIQKQNTKQQQKEKLQLILSGRFQQQYKQKLKEHERQMKQIVMSIQQQNKEKLREVKQNLLAINLMTKMYHQL